MTSSVIDKFNTPKRCHMDLRSARLVLTIHYHRHRLHFSLLYCHPKFIVSNSFFFIHGAFSLEGCPFAFFLVKQRAAFQLCFLSKHVVRVTFPLAHWPPVWLPRQLSHRSGSRRVPWLLLLRLWPPLNFSSIGPASSA